MTALPSDPSPLLSFEHELEVLLETFMHDYRISRTMWIISLALLLYDWCLTFGDEVKYIWGGRFKWTSLLFGFNRYWPICVLIFDNTVLAVAHNTDVKFCKAWVNFMVYSQTPYEASICAIYILRIYALYGCNKKLLAIISAIYVCVIVSENTIIVFAVRNMIFDPPPLPTITGCLPTNIKTYSWTFWLPMLTFESILLLLSIIRPIIMRVRRGATISRIMFVLLRDAFIYFGGVFLAILSNVLGWRLGGNFLFTAFIPLAIMSFSILGCRLLLNIQATADPIYDPGVLSTLGQQDPNAPVMQTNATQTLQFHSVVRSEDVDECLE